MLSGGATNSIESGRREHVAFDAIATTSLANGRRSLDDPHDDLCYAVRSYAEANTPNRYLKVAPFQEKGAQAFYG
jgi:hypothetical protein